MTALLALITRLRQARLMLRFSIDQLERQGEGPVMTAITGGADVIELSVPDSDQAVARDWLRRMRQRPEWGQRMVVVDATAQTARAVGADLLLISAANTSVVARAREQLSPWSLLGYEIDSEAAVESAMVDPEIDFGICAYDPTLIGRLQGAAPVGQPASLPWFVRCDHDQVDAALANGARRIAVAGAISDTSDARDATRKIRARIDQVWRDDPQLRRANFTAFAGPGHG